MFDTIINNIFTVDFVISVIRMSTPILLASMAAIMTSKAGITNIIIDGTMLTSALVGTLVSAYTQSLILACIAGLLTGIALKLFLGFFHLIMDTPANLTGVAINLLTTGGTVFLTYIFAGDKGSTSKLQSLRFPNVHIPFIQDIPIIGKILSGHNLLTYVAFLSVGFVFVLLTKTALGLRIRAVGEYSKAVSSVGENPNKIKFIALVFSGIFAALAGMYLSMGYVGWFTRGMTGSRGFIGIAADAIGQSSPLYVMFAAVMFAAVEAFGNVLQVLQLPVELILALPYAVTLIVLAVNSSREITMIKNKKKAAIKEFKDGDYLKEN